MAWVTEGPQTDPSNGTVLADTGALGVTTTAFTILVDTNAAFYGKLALRNSLNTADVNVQTVYVHPSFPSPLVSVTMTPGLNQRLVFRTGEDVTGTVQISIVH